MKWNHKDTEALTVADDLTAQDLETFDLHQKKNELINSFHSDLHYYKSQHRTKGCKITHMIGVPLIAASMLALPFNRKLSRNLNMGGWALQMVGHFIFEHNKPVTLEVRTPFMFASALVFTYEQWKKVLQGEPL